jgi:hypothetical protein
MQISILPADPEAIRMVSFVSNPDSITILLRKHQRLMLNALRWKLF